MAKDGDLKNTGRDDMRDTLYSAAESLVDQALELEGEERLKFLQSISDLKLRKYVEAWIDNYNKSDGDSNLLEEERAQISNRLFVSFHLLSPDTRLMNRYRIVETLGTGGMGAVYKAIDEVDAERKVVAIKQLIIEHKRIESAFEREGVLLKHLRHECLPLVYHQFAENNSRFLIMEFIEGDNLEEELKKRGKPFPVNKVLEWADQLLDVLQYLHTRVPPVYHHDIKPANLKQSKSRVILLDFGLARGSVREVFNDSKSVTVLGVSPGYSPPEQYEGKGNDPRSDLYALAATLYFLLTGEEIPTAPSRTHALSNKKPDPLRPIKELQPDLPGDIARLLMRTLSTNRNLRPKSALAMRKALIKARASHWSIRLLQEIIERLHSKRVVTSALALTIGIIGLAVFHTLYNIQYVGGAWQRVKVDNDPSDNVTLTIEQNWWKIGSVFFGKPEYDQILQGEYKFFGKCRYSEGNGCFEYIVTRTNKETKCVNMLYGEMWLDPADATKLNTYVYKVSNKCMGTSDLSHSFRERSWWEKRE